jgi:hypothetical protein
VKGRKKKKFNKNGNNPTGLGVDPRPVGYPGPAGNQRLPAGCKSTPGPVGLSQIFLKFEILKKMNFWKFGKCAWAFGRMGVQCPHFLKLALTLGSANSSKIHGEWRFHFFPNFLFPKFSSYLDLHIYRWDFCFIKKLIH